MFQRNLVKLTHLVFKVMILFERTNIFPEPSPSHQPATELTLTESTLEPYSTCMSVRTVSVQEVDGEEEEDHTN